MVSLSHEAQLKLISRNTDYAVRAVCYIARQDKRIVSVIKLVKALGIPGPFLRKILQVLNKKRILISNKGSGGGFKLARKEDKIFLSELMEAFQGPFRLNECTFKKELCPNKKFCWLKNKIDIIEDMVLSQLSTVTIDSILKGK